MWDKAVDYERKAAEGAIEASSYQAAQDFCQKALDHLERMPRTRDTISLGISTRLLLRVAIGATPDFSSWLRMLTDAEKLATEIHDFRTALICRVQAAFALTFQGDVLNAIETASAALGEARSSENKAAEVLARYALGQAFFSSGAYSNAVQALLPAVDYLSAEREMAHIGTTATTSILCRSVLACAYASMGRHDDADLVTKRSRETARRTNNVYDMASASYGYGATLVLGGNFAAATAVLQSGLALCEKHGIGVLSPLIGGQLGAAHLGCRDIGAAEATLRTAADRARSIGHAAALCAAEALYSMALAAREDYATAERFARSAHQDARTRGLRGLQSLAARALATAIFRQSSSRREEALAMIEESCELARACEAAPALRQSSAFRKLLVEARM